MEGVETKPKIGSVHFVCELEGVFPGLDVCTPSKRLECDLQIVKHIESSQPP